MHTSNRYIRMKTINLNNSLKPSNYSLVLKNYQICLNKRDEFNKITDPLHIWWLKVFK